MSFWSEVDEMIQKGKKDKQIKVTIQELVDVRSEIELKNIKIGQLEKKVKDLIEKSADLTQKLLDTIQSVENLEKKNVSLKSDIDLSNKESLEKNMQMDSMNNQNVQSQQQLAELKVTNSQFAQQTVELKNETVKLQQQIIELRNQNVKLQQQIVELRNQIIQIQQNDTTDENDTQKLNQLIQIEQQKLVAAINQNQSLMEQNQQLIKQIQQLKNTQGDETSTDTFTEKNQLITKLQMQNQQINQQLIQLKESQVNINAFNSLKTENEQIKAQLFAGSQQLTTLQQEIGRMKTEIVEKDKKIQELSQPRQVIDPQILNKGISREKDMFQPQSEARATEYVIDEEQTEDDLQRRQCPNCGSLKVNEVSDKTRIISYIPKTTYGMKSVCTQCSYEW